MLWSGLFDANIGYSWRLKRSALPASSTLKMMSLILLYMEMNPSALSSSLGALRVGDLTVSKNW